MLYFRFCRAIGGHANDPDILLCALRVESEETLIHLTRALEIPLLEQPAVGQAFRAGRNRPTPIETYPQFTQPGRVQLAGVDCFVWVGSDRLEISVFGAASIPYEVDLHDVENARKIEELLAPFADRAIDPPNDRCFTL